MVDVSVDAITCGFGRNGSKIFTDGDLGSAVAHCRKDVVHIADGKQHTGGHAALTSATREGSDDIFCSDLQVCVGHHNQVILGAAEAECAHAVGARASVHRLGNLGATNEPQRLDFRVITQRFHYFTPALHHVEDTSGKPRLCEQFRQSERRERHALARLEDEGIAADQCLRQHPQWNHHREVEWGNASHHAKRNIGKFTCHAAAHFKLVACRKVRQRAAVLHAFDTFFYFRLRFAEHFAVLMREEPGEFVQILQHQFTQAVQDMRTVTDGPLPPVARRCRSYLYGGSNVIGCAHLYLCNDFAKARVDHIVHGGAGDRVAPLAADPVPCGGVGDEIVTAGGEWLDCWSEWCCCHD